MHVAVEAVGALVAESLVGCEHRFEVSRIDCSVRINGPRNQNLVSCVVDSTSQADCAHSSLAHNLLERAESVVERTLTAAASQREVALQRPSALVVSILERRNNRRDSLSLEVAWSSRIVHVVCEQLVVVIDCTCLPSSLPVDSEVASFAHKYNTCRVIIHTINTNRSLAAHHTIECDVLVGVSEKTTSKSRAA